MRNFRGRNSLEDINEEPSIDHGNQEDILTSHMRLNQASRNVQSNLNDSNNQSHSNQQDLSESGVDSARVKGEDPVSIAQREQMNQQIKIYQEKSHQEGAEAIQRAQNLVKQIEKQAKKRGIGEDDDKRQKHYQDLIRKKREYEEEYLKKNKEFYLTQGMDMNKIQNFIIENFEMNLQKQREKLNEEIKVHEQLQELNYAENRKLFPQRLPQVADIRNHFFRQSQEIFKPLKQIEIKQIYQEIKEKQKGVDVQEYMEPRASDKVTIRIKCSWWGELEEHYYRQYEEWSNSQPSVEDQRNRLKELYADCFELASTLNNQPESLEKPTIWHSLQFSEGQQAIADKWMQKKNLIKNNKYGFLEDEDDFQADDILQKVEKYLDTELFISTYDKEENVSDEELNKLQPKGMDEPYNEATIDFYDKNEDSEQER